MPTDIFPEIDIPVVSVVWTVHRHAADEIENRIISINERQLPSPSTTSSTSRPDAQRRRRHQGLLPPGANIEPAVSQVTASAQTVLKSMPPGITPAVHRALQRHQRADHADQPLQRHAVRAAASTTTASNCIRQQPGDRPGRTVPLPLRRQAAPVSWWTSTSKALQAKGLSPDDVSDAINDQNLIMPAGDAKIGAKRVHRAAQQQPRHRSTAFNDIPIKTVNGVDGLHAGRGPRARRLSRCRPTSSAATASRGALMTILKSGGASTLDVVERVQDDAARTSRPRCRRGCKIDRCSTSRSSSGRPSKACSRRRRSRPG